MMSIEQISLAQREVEYKAQISVLMELKKQIDHKIESLEDNIRTVRLLFQKEVEKARQELSQK